MYAIVSIRRNTLCNNVSTIHAIFSSVVLTYMCSHLFHTFGKEIGLNFFLTNDGAVLF